MSRRGRAALATAVVLLAAVAGWVALAGGPSRADTPRTRLAPGHTPASGPPVARIRIPAIGVDAEVVRLGLNRDRTLQVPARSSQAGWWTGGAVPGRRGTAVIVGHVDSRAGPAVFFRLRRLRPGDRVAVTLPGRPAARFRVQRKEEFSKSRFPTRRVYTPTRAPSLRLITCGGRFDESTGHYRDNVVVFGAVLARSTIGLRSSRTAR
jgi:sortase (surface protein transpeptidase)